VKALEKQITEHRKGTFVISTDEERFDLDMVHGFLAESYWAEGFLREVVVRSIQNSLCFGMFCDGKQIDFARVISDYATFAYIGDVFVLESYRGHGLGKWLMECIVGHPRAARSAPLDPADARCPRTLRPIRFHAAQKAREIHGAA
jgi:GNAT superfamily N-acetyltransferase